MVHGTNHFFFSPRQPLHSIICSIPGQVRLLVFLSSSIGDFLTFFLQRPAYYAADLPNVYASLRLLTFFQDKEDSALLTPPLLR